MKRKNTINFIKIKQNTGSILIWMLLLLISIFAIEVYADTIIGGTEGEIANEKTMVRMAADLSRGNATDNKITITSLSDNLDRYAGSGRTSVTEKSSTMLLVTFTKTGNQYEVDVNNGPVFSGVGIMAPYIPLGYTQVPGTDLDRGFVIQDGNGNQYVWIEVPKTVYVYQNAGLKVTEFSEADYQNIEKDLQTYTATYRNGTTYVDEYFSDEATGLTSSEYNIQKKKMLKSIYKNGGFYIGRYETGIAYDDANGLRTAAGETTQTPVIKQHAYPYAYLTTSQAQELSESFATDGYTSSLLFGVQWDLVLKYLESKGAATQAELNEDSTSWGNYKNSTYNITNSNAKYGIMNSSGVLTEWQSAPYSKTEESTILLTTGASNTFSKQNISDLAGNVWERSLAKSNDTSNPYVILGGSCWQSGQVDPASTAGGVSVSNDSAADWGFRVALYKDEGVRGDGEQTLPYLPTGYTQLEGTTLDTGLVIQDAKGNQYVWVEVPRSAAVYKTAGINVTNFSDEDYERMENDLHTYTATYRNGTAYVDEYYSDETTGLTEYQYNMQKKKMLKSIYKNEGFYVGRYETGIADSYRTAAGAITQVPVIQANAYPYNFVTTSQAQDLAMGFASEGYQTSLMFGVQWDLVLRYLEMTGTSKSELTTDSTNWGNYKNTTYNITNASAKYSTSEGTTYLSAPYNKTSSGSVLLTTGAIGEFSKQNIYDLAGNLWEKTLEYSGNPEAPWADRGCGYGSEDAPVNLRSDCPLTWIPSDLGFRVTLYKDEGTGRDDVEPTYIPDGYAHVPGTDMDSGYVVQDPYGNQYVWIEVPRTATVYPTAGTGITEFTVEAYTKIENDLHTYTSVYRNGTTYADEYSSEEATGLTNVEYSIQKRKMLKSIYKNEGFYVGRYETGIDYEDANGFRTASGEITQAPVIKKNAYTYNWVTTSQAQELSQSFATNGYTGSLMFGVQWDLVLKYLESKGTSQSDLITDSTSWGNYLERTFNITNTSANYSVDAGVTYASAPYIKNESSEVMLTTGASSKFSNQNIYDLAGNAWELTMEYSYNSDKPIVVRGGSWNNNGVDARVRRRTAVQVFNTGRSIGFRVALYTDEELETATPYLPEGYSYVAQTDLDTGLVIQDASGNQYVWVEVPQTTSVYKTAGLNVTEFSDTDYEKIEKDLHTYTTVYRQSTSSVDEYYSDEATGLSSTQYTYQKKKMLKSIYKNGGFYVGRYETGIESSFRTSSSKGTIAEQPVIKQNAYVYNYISTAQAQELASSFTTAGVTASLMFNVQWDLIMKYLESTGTAQSQLTQDSSTWGNYGFSEFSITNTNAKYTLHNSNTYSSAPYTKSSGSNVLLTTGASDSFSKQNIYDLAGNVDEMTLAIDKNSSWPNQLRGWSYYNHGSQYLQVATGHRGRSVDIHAFDSGFRVALYKDEAIDAESPMTLKSYEYAGEVKEFTVPYTGTYKLEVWGASGGSLVANGSSIVGNYNGGAGGYSVGEVQLTAGEKLYIAVGGAGTGATSTGQSLAGGFNGGGSVTGNSTINHMTASGGGATHIVRTNNRGELYNYENYQDEILIVAGGGGGARDQSNHVAAARWGHGGAGGGLQGGGAISSYGSTTELTVLSAGAGTQTSGYAFGLGSSASAQAAGGGGFYGGQSGSYGNTGSGSGGSGYISSVLTNASTIVGTESIPTHDGSSTMTGNTGNGYAKITFIAN